MQCPICQEPFDKLDALNSHIDVKHPIPGTESKAKKYVDDSRLNVEKRRLNVSDGGIGVKSREAELLMAKSDVVSQTKNTPTATVIRPNNAVSTFPAIPTSTKNKVDALKPSPAPLHSTSPSASASASPSTSLLKHSASTPTLSQEGLLQAPGIGIKKTHWKPETGNDPCCVCGKTVGLVIGRHHCRKCGNFCCNTHFELEMKLDLEARHDPENGIWAKVCNICYQSKEGFFEMNAISNHTLAYVKRRKTHFDLVRLDSHRLANRLEKLCKLYGNNSNSNSNNITRQDEESIVRWQPDEDSNSCQFCQEKFVFLINPRHHCRLCGLLLCGEETCSNLIPIHLGSNQSEPLFTVRICPVCHKTLNQTNVLSRYCGTNLSEADKERDQIISELMTLYKKMSDLKKDVIGVKLPVYNELLAKIRKVNRLDTKLTRDYETAVKLRKELMESLVSLEATAKRIRDLRVPTGTIQFQKLYRNICIHVNQYLQNHMFTLQMLPRFNSRTGNILLASSSAAATTTISQNQGKDESDRSSISSNESTTSNNKRNFFSALFSSSQPSAIQAQQPSPSNNIPSLGELQELEKIYGEQKHHIEEMIVESIGAKRIEDVKSLRLGLQEIEKELTKIRKLIRKASSS